MSFGYIGTAGKTQTQISNSGIFSLDEVQDLKDDFKYAGQGLLCDFLVVAGGSISSALRLSSITSLYKVSALFL